MTASQDSQRSKRPGVLANLRRLARYLFVRPVIVMSATVLLLAALIAQSIQPLLFGRAVNDLANGRTDSLDEQALVIIILALITWVFRWTAANLVAIAAQTAMKQLREELFKKMQTLSLGFHESRSTGELMSRITSDTEVINTFLSTSLFGLASAAIQLIAVTLIMIFIDVTLAIVVVALAPVSLLVMALIGRRTARSYGAVQRSVGRINGFLEERVTGQKTLQAYGQASASVDELLVFSEDARDADERASFLGFAVMPLVRLVSNADVAALALIGGIRVVRGATSIGSVVSFLGYAQQFSAPIGQISRSMNQAIQASAGATRVFDLLDEMPAITDEPSARPIDHADGDVAFDDVEAGAGGWLGQGWQAYSHF